MIVKALFDNKLSEVLNDCNSLKKVNLSEMAIMTKETIRKKLHDFIADAEDKKVKGMYLLLEDEINKKEFVHLTDEHFEI